MKTTALATLPIPPILLQTWLLPPDWDEHVWIFVAGSDFAQGKGERIVATIQGRQWVFTARREWVPEEYRDNGLHFCELDAATFCTVLIGMVVGVGSCN